MTSDKTKETILTMRRGGASFAEIAGMLSLSPNTVKSICYRSKARALPAADDRTGVCRNCGRPLPEPAAGRKRIFCSSQCRYSWWNCCRSRKPYRLTCYCCGKEFISFGNKKKKYCSRECRRISHYGEGSPPGAQMADQH